MFRTIIAGAAVAGALTFGAAGIAGASTPAPGSTSAHKAALCAKLPALQAKVQKVEAKVATWVPKAQAREATLRTDGKTQLADAIAKRITRLQNRETKFNARLAKAQAACNAGGTSAG
jgi:phage shock protein A